LIGLLLVLEVPLHVRLTEALARTDRASDIALGLHVVVVVGCSHRSERLAPLP
jgi:hypothetical protein